MADHNPSSKRIVMLIAGTGSLLPAVADTIRLNQLNAAIVAAISHDRWGYGLMRAERYGIPTLLHDFADYRANGYSEHTYANDLATQIEAHQPHLVMMAGWQRPLTDEFYGRLGARLVTIHSSNATLQPARPFENNASQLYEAFRAGAIHDVRVSLQQPTLASPQIIAEQRVPIYHTDHLIDLEERLLRTEQELLANTLHLLLRD